MIQVGQRVRTKQVVDKWPNFLIEPGKLGTVTYVGPDMMRVLMDEFVYGCEEWDNEVYFDESSDEFTWPSAEYLEVITGEATVEATGETTGEAK